MKDRGRGATTMASSAGRRPRRPRADLYGAAKVGIVILTQDAAQAGPHGVGVTCIAPETILAALNRERILPVQQAAMAYFPPLERLGTPDVAKAAVFLASGDVGWITGESSTSPAVP